MSRERFVPNSFQFDFFAEKIEQRCALVGQGTGQLASLAKLGELSAISVSEVITSYIAQDRI